MTQAHLKRARSSGVKHLPNDPVLIRFYVDKHPQLTCSASASVLPLGLNIRLYILRKCWSCAIGHSFCEPNKSHSFKMCKTSTVGFRANSQLLWVPRPPVCLQSILACLCWCRFLIFPPFFVTPAPSLFLLGETLWYKRLERVLPSN